MILLCLRGLWYVMLWLCYGCICYECICYGCICYGCSCCERSCCERSCYGCACWVSVSGGSITFRWTHPQQHEVHRLWNTVFSTSTAAAETTVISDAHSVGVQVTIFVLCIRKFTTSSASRTTRVNTSPPCSYVAYGTMHAVFRPNGRQPCTIAMACGLCTVGSVDRQRTKF